MGKATDGKRVGRPKGASSLAQPVGARSASGRKRDREPMRLTPTDGVVRRQAAFSTGGKGPATSTCDAIGRAYCAGLLGTDRDVLLNTARGLAQAYWRHFPGLLTADSLARFQPGLGGGVPDEDRERRRELQLTARLAMLNAMGAETRRAVDQLAIDPYPDEGPGWVDRLCEGRGSDADRRMMAAALSGPRRPARDRDAAGHRAPRAALQDGGAVGH